jgi:hypothetical protein
MIGLVINSVCTKVRSNWPTHYTKQVILVERNNKTICFVLLQFAIAMAQVCYIFFSSIYFKITYKNLMSTPNPMMSNMYTKQQNGNVMVVQNVILQ